MPSLKFLNNEFYLYVFLGFNVRIRKEGNSKNYFDKFQPLFKKMGTFQHHNVCLLLTSLLCLLLWTEAAEKRVHYVPSQVQPGHIITVFKHQPHHTMCTIHSSSIGNDFHKYFALVNQQILTTASNITRLQGKVVWFKTEFKSPTRKWTEVASMKIGNTIPDVHFSDTPYFGLISENQPIGTPVLGLDALVKSVQHMPKDCQLSLDSGDTQSFKLGMKPPQLVELTALVTFDREVKSSHYVMIKAECLTHAPAYAYVYIDVSDQNDNSPTFKSPNYFVNIKLEEMKKDKEIVKVRKKNSCMIFSLLSLIKLIASLISKR